jgi:GT2 family glycosyltransferase/glycosyltransferase involved in cell wall biosynthesis
MRLGPPNARRQAKSVAERVAPRGSVTRSALRVARQVSRDLVDYMPRARSIWRLAAQPAAVEPDYRDWLARTSVTPGQLVDQIERSAIDGRGTAVEVVVLPSLRAPNGRAAAETIEALVQQTDPAWRAHVLAGTGADDVRCDDRRVTVVHLEGRDPLALADRLMSEGDPAALVVVLEAGDLVEPDWVFELRCHAWDDPEARLLHWDDDVLDADGGLVDPRIRPGWSPDTLLGANYLGRSFAVRRAAVVDAGGVRTDLADTTWWDLVLRLDLDEGSVARIPRVLVHLVRRLVESRDRAVGVVQEHFERNGRAGAVEPGLAGLRVRWALDEPPPVTIVIPTRHNVEMLSRCLPSLAATDYPSFDVVIIDNGGRSPDAEAWYAEHADGLDLAVRWWDEPFNYSRVNNVAAADAKGEVLVFLNDDTELVDPGWLREMVGWAVQPDIGLVGLQLLDGDGRIQHGGVIVGVNGFADHLFAGMAPHSDSLMGPTDWYRDVLSVTAACVAVERSLFERVGGFDERFILCGSDVVLGFDTRFLGLRNVVSAAATVLHLESVTRGSSVPVCDFHASYWRYQKYMRGGDPYFSPALSPWSGAPALRGADESNPMRAVGDVLGRDFTVFRQKADEAESVWLSDICRADDATVDAVEALHAGTRGRVDVTSVNWFFPDIDSPFYGGINTALRIADHLARHHGVAQRFVVMANPNEDFFRSALAAAFPALADVPVTFIEGPTDPDLDRVPYADVSIATLWVTAYSVARFGATRRKFYLIQDFEPQFYPAGTNYALTEEGYRLGLYGLCNTRRLLDIYRGQYGGTGGAFMPAVDQTVFHAEDRRPLRHEGPVTVFVYARPGHWRNCWEMASLALAQLKERYGDDVRIVTAGSWARPDDLGRGIEHLGLIDYRDTGELYRRCDVGVALTVSAHPSYLPLELMACGVPVVAFDNPAGDWILHHDQNSLRCRRTVDGLAGALDRLVGDAEARERLGKGALETIAEGFSDWDRALSGVYDILCDPTRSD